MPLSKRNVLVSLMIVICVQQGHFYYDDEGEPPERKSHGYVVMLQLYRKSIEDQNYIVMYQGIHQHQKKIITPHKRQHLKSPACHTHRSSLYIDRREHKHTYYYHKMHRHCIQYPFQQPKEEQ